MTPTEMKRRLDRLEIALETIKNDPRQSLEHQLRHQAGLGPYDRQWQVGFSDGLRAAAQTARDALLPLEVIIDCDCDLPSHEDDAACRRRLGQMSDDAMEDLDG